MSEILLVEEMLPNEAHIVQEDSQDGKDTWLSGIYMQAEIQNRNGRKYPIKEMQIAVETAQKMINEKNGIMGELDHPNSLNINLDRVSHIITEMSMDGNNVMGKAKLLNTPMGLIAKELINSGIALGVSSRGAGSINESGDVSGFQFLTVDLVANPSAPDAVPQSIRESLETATNQKEIITLAEHFKHDDAAQKYLKTEILKWIKEGLKRD